MTRSITMGADWDGMHCSTEGKRLRVTTRFSLELAPDLIVTPLVHAHRNDLPRRRDGG